MSKGLNGGQTVTIPLPAKDEVYGEYDIMVFGGGSAGCTAAIQAARAGKRTALVEKNGILGGTTIVASVNFPGLFHAWGKQVIRGIGWEIIERTAELDGAELPDFSVVPPRHWKHQILVNRFIYSAVLDQLCMESGVSLRLHEMPAAVRKGEDGLYVALVGKSGLRWFKTRKLVDATGDADVAGMMGYARRKGEVLQPGTLINDIGGYDPAAVDEGELGRLYEEALLCGEVDRSRNGLYNDLRAGRINMHVQHIDGSESESRTAAEVKARRNLLDTVRLLRRVPGCEKLEVRYVANECGIRETWRIDGEAEVDEQSYVSGYVWPDAVCYSFYPIDLHHHSGYHIEQKYLQPGIVATLPYRALIPKGSDDLLVAGRCISGDRMANSAFRVQASCMATGQAAGMAAAIAAELNCSVRDVPMELLREHLERSGAIVPEIPISSME
ncbi:FAD-dependent oxidoreductase [Paenibacillus sp. GCM10012303]|uniref:FAD-dependent oxidoreductase n=1 Tax=Paenibacillus sp. GCM10012303 TaxID=3317340 RepID=UPI00360D2D0F